MNPIEFKGLKELDDVDQRMAQTLAKEYYGKIQRELRNITSLVVHIKTDAKEGHRHRYEVTVRAVAPTRIFESRHGKEKEGWDLASALHGAFKNLEREIQHHFHSEKGRRTGHDLKASKEL
ncbi:HPF/RaiA family ribosome-associated protein [Candidatus Woesearchaeota archaeon]|nr:HPF/RaiA family ribosome-associated protein [Candidatus Woesearchaeota archaeon]